MFLEDFVPKIERVAEYSPSSSFAIHLFRAIHDSEPRLERIHHNITMGLFHLIHRCRCIILLAYIYPFGCVAVSPYLGLHTSTSVLLPKQSLPEKKNGKKSASFLLTLKQQKYNRSFRDTVNEIVTGEVRKPSHRYFQHALYWMTAADSIISIILNEYTVFSFPGASIAAPFEKQGVVREVYSKLFYFARMRPRLLYSIGALVRALSLCTPLRHLMDPTVGVGAGIHFFAHLACARWVKPLILGWATTKAFWIWLGARPVDRAFIPITLSIHEWEEKKAKKSSNIDESDK